MLTHGHFTEADDLDYEWLSSDPNVDKEVARAKVYSIFMERSKILFNND
jgi:hypothetical protein